MELRKDAPETEPFFSVAKAILEILFRLFLIFMRNVYLPACTTMSDMPAASQNSSGN
jgi:hypothetical protein